MGGLVSCLRVPRAGRWRGGILLVLLLGSSAMVGAAEPIRAAYIYDYMDLDHLDSLAAARFNRVIVRLIGDSLGAYQAAQLEGLFQRGRELGISVVPDFLLQSKARLNSLKTVRRYTWGPGNLEPEVACPLDTSYWKSALFDHAEEVLGTVPDARAIAIDLELQDGSRSHYDAGPCRCPTCLAEYTGAEGRHSAREAWKLSGLMAFQESRLTDLLSIQLGRFALLHPGVELGVFDLDFDSFVHRALARSLARSRVATTDYCERTYPSGAGLPGARARLRAIGCPNARLAGGVWLKRWAPDDLPATVHSIRQRADGYFIFTTFSLWEDPSLLAGPYTLMGPPADYWRAFRKANRSP